MNAQSQTVPAAGRHSVVAVILLAALILPLSFSGGAVTTPAIGRDLGGTATALTWITNSFMLTFGSLLMISGTLADQFGRKRVFMTGVTVFTLTSLALSFAPSVWLMDLLRAVQVPAPPVRSRAALRPWRRSLMGEPEPSHSRCSAPPSASGWRLVR